MSRLCSWLRVNWSLIGEVAIILAIWTAAGFMYQLWSPFMGSLVAGIGLAALSLLFQGSGNLLNGFDTCSCS